jgi:hypothetical protein
MTEFVLVSELVVVAERKSFAAVEELDLKSHFEIETERIVVWVVENLLQIALDLERMGLTQVVVDGILEIVFVLDLNLDMKMILLRSVLIAEQHVVVVEMQTLIGLVVVLGLH